MFNKYGSIINDYLIKGEIMSNWWKNFMYGAILAVITIVLLEVFYF